MPLAFLGLIPFVFAAALALVSLPSGWYALSRRYPAKASGTNGRTVVPLSINIGGTSGYTLATKLTLTEAGLLLRALLLYRLMHPPKGVSGSL